jgi:hypothetical protein
MRRGILIVLLSAGAIFGYASGFHHLRYGHHGWHGGGYWGCGCNNAASQPTCGHP